MNILVTGANGQLGSAIRVATAHSKDNYLFADIAEREGFVTYILDITNAKELDHFIKLHNIKVIVNCAAFTNVDAAEDNASAAEMLNSTAVEYLSSTAKRHDVLLIHISTDYVFGGTKCNIPCDETMTTNPTGVYGQTKLSGEKAIIASGCQHIIIRTAWLYSEYGKNFVKTMLALTSSRDEIKVVFDQVGTPTYALDLAKAIHHIIDSRQYTEHQELYHYSNEGVCSWFDFATFIAQYAGNTKCRIIPCHSAEFPSKVIRPSYSVLDKRKIKHDFGINIPYWTISLKKCIENLTQNKKSCSTKYD